VTRAAATAWLLLAVPFTSLSAILPKLAAEPGAVTAFWRFAVACTLMLPLLSWDRRSHRRAPQAAGDPVVRRRASWAALAAGVAVGLDIAVWNHALLSVPAAEAMLLGHTAPLWVGLFGWALWGRRPGGIYWAGCALACGGMALFVADRLGAGEASLAGLALCVLAGALYAVYMLLAHEARVSMRTLPFLLVSQLVAAVVCAVTALGVGATLTGFSPATWGWLVASGLAGLAGGWSLVLAMGRFSPTTVSIVMLLQVPVAALMAWWVFGEALVGAQALGAGLMLAAVALVYARPPALEAAPRR
jgi:drug/metabolite transporter (DMT)-like permease